MIADPIVKRIALRTGRSAAEVMAEIQRHWWTRATHRLALWINDRSGSKRW